MQWQFPALPDSHPASPLHDGAILDTHMKYFVRISAATCCLFSSTALVAQLPAPVNLFVADVTYDNGSIRIGNPRKLTGDRGVSSQPSFTPDGKAILFVSRRDTTGQSDIYRIDLATGAETQITKTSENENSPTVTPDGNIMVIRWTPATLFKEWGPWIYDNTGKPLSGVLPGPDTVGYYVRVDSVTFAMMRPKSRPAIALFDTRKGTMTDFAWPVANLPPQIVPGRRAISFTQIDSLGHNQIKIFDLASLQTSTLVPTLVGRTVHAWTPNGFVLMGKGGAIYAVRPGKDANWRKVADMRRPELQGLTVYAVSPGGDKVILISPLKPLLQQALRDSIQSGADVAKVIHRFRAAKSGVAGKYDTAESGLLSLAAERSARGKASDAIEIIRFAAELHPKSYSSQLALGQALTKSGDQKAALVAFKKSLALNPRVSVDDKNAAEAAEKAITALNLH